MAALHHTLKFVSIASLHCDELAVGRPLIDPEVSRSSDPVFGATARCCGFCALGAGALCRVSTDPTFVVRLLNLPSRNRDVSLTMTTPARA